MNENFSIFAPAKVNLYLHITGKRDDGYHTLDSLAVFADIGDWINIEPYDEFRLYIKGPFSSSFTAKDRDSTPSSSNLVARAAWGLARMAQREPKVKITLTKNLPLASGLGGGSADAAAVLWGLMKLWSVPLSSPWIPGLMKSLGADVPACLRCMPVRMTGIGDILQDFPDLPDIPGVLINPLKHCSTADIFGRFTGPLSHEIHFPEDLSSMEDMISFLGKQRNDLTAASVSLVPEIADIMDFLKKCKGCLLHRMSGSGASVFGLFDTGDAAATATEEIQAAHPEWWSRTATFNRPGRY